MPHQNTDSPKAKRADTREQEASLDAESRSYAADDMDEGDALGADDVQQGSNHLNRLDGGEKLYGQGRKTREGNLNRLKTGSAS